MSKRDWHAFWSSSSAPSVQTKASRAGNGKSAAWESSTAAEIRLRKEAHNRMKADEEEQRLQWRFGNPGCKKCAGRFFVLRRAAQHNSGYSYVTQCTTCLSAMRRRGWGCATTFSRDDDIQICNLLNRHGAPMNAAAEPSGIHFYKSALTFYHFFAAKQWDALTRHIQSNFTTTWSLPLAGGKTYRGWYNKTTRQFPGAAPLANVAI